MTSEELCERYVISTKLLKEYSDMGVRDTNGRQYDDHDVEYISMMMTLKEIGFNKNDMIEYMRMYVADSGADKRKMMLNKKRASTLDKIHAEEARLSKIDYLRYNIQNGAKK